MAREFAGIAIITVLAILGRLLEDCRKIGLSPKGSRKRLTNIGGLYECFNFHLNLSLGMLGLLWTTSGESSAIITVFIFILLGVASKGVFSQHKPDRLSLKDLDARYGFFVPNACALACVCVVAGMILSGEKPPSTSPPDRSRNTPPTHSTE